VLEIESKAIRVIIVFLAIYLFLVSIALIGSAFSLFGNGFAEGLIKTASNPFVGLFIGIIATSLVQSSSATTSIVVGVVAGGMLPLSLAMPIIMGANVGTSVTNTLVSLGSFSRKLEFQRAFAGATLHDFFNLIAILILFPIELFTGVISNTALFLAQLFEGVGGFTFISPVKMVVKPASEMIVSLLGGHPIAILAVAGLFLFVALSFISSNVRAIVAEKAEALLDVYLFKNDSTAFCFGMVLTSLVQSSSITTSIVVPLIGAGMLSLRKAFPFTLGANVGTTVTAFLAALAISTPLAVAVSVAHLLFNIFGIIIVYPFKHIPIKMAEGLGRLAFRSSKYALLYVAGVFFLIPLIIIFLTQGG
jgi:sodium-dependent phosphate cotransporter